MTFKKVRVFFGVAKAVTNETISVTNLYAEAEELTFKFKSSIENDPELVKRLEDSIKMLVCVSFVNGNQVVDIFACHDLGPVGGTENGV